MSSLYNKNYVEVIPEDTLNKIITGEFNVDLSVNNLKNKKCYVALQHYLIKYLEHNGKTKDVNRFLNKYYNDFVDNPHLFVDSPLIGNDFLDKYISKDNREKLKKIKDAYFDGSVAKRLYEKSKSQELTEEEKNRLYSYFINQMDIGNNTQKNIWEYCCKKILNSGKEIKNMNEMELKFYSTYISKAVSYSVPTEIHIMSDKPTRGGLQNNYLILINKDNNKYKTVEDLTHMVCHEVRHSKQKKESTNKNTKLAFDYSMKELFIKYLDTSEYDSYNQNYRYSAIEIDAENSGYSEGAVLLDMLGRKDLGDKLRKERQNDNDKRNYYEYLLDSNKKHVPADYYVVENMNRIIKDHPEELNKYKVLNNIYDTNGNEYPFDVILDNRIHQDLNEKGIYDNYVNYGIMNDKLNTIDLGIVSKDKQRDLFNSLSYMLKDSTNTFIDYCNDTEIKNNFNEKQVEKSTYYQLGLVYKTLSYVDENMDYILDTKEESKIDNSSYIYNFILSLRDFDPNNIKNDVIKNSPMLQESIDRVMEKHRSVTKKFNRQYIKDRVNNLSTEQLNKTIKSPEGVDMPLNDYLYFDLLPRLDGHMKADINGKKVYVGDIIKHYSNEVMKNNNSEIKK